MGFIRIPGFKGKVFVPEETPGCVKKHDCPDCYSCQMCSDGRCGLCRKPSPAGSPSCRAAGGKGWIDPGKNR